MKKQHQIRTMDDIFKIITSENVERFLSDFNASMLQVAYMNDLLSRKEKKEMSYDVYKWTDDNVKRATLQITVNPKL